MGLRVMAEGLKAKTDRGAILMFDGELWDKPIWVITRDEVSFGSTSARIMLWKRGEGWGTQAEGVEVLKKRVRVLVDA